MDTLWYLFLFNCAYLERALEEIIAHYKGLQIKGTHRLRFENLSTPYPIQVSFWNENWEDEHEPIYKNIVLYDSEEFEKCFLFVYIWHPELLDDDLYQKIIHPKLERTKERFEEYKKRIGHVLDNYGQAVQFAYCLYSKFTMDALPYISKVLRKKNIEFDLVLSFESVFEYTGKPAQKYSVPDQTLLHIETMEVLPLFVYEKLIIIDQLEKKHPGLIKDMEFITQSLPRPFEFYNSFKSFLDYPKPLPPEKPF